VTADSYQQVFEGTDRSASQATSGAVTVNFNTLTPGVTATGQFAGDGDEQWYDLPTVAGQNYQLTLSRTGSGGTTQIYVGANYAPDQQNFDASAGQSGGTMTTLDLQDTQAGDYYIMIMATGIGTTPASYQLVAQPFNFQATGMSPHSGGNAGQVTITITGEDIPQNATAALTTASSQVISPSASYWQDPGHLVVAFNLAGSTPGAATMMLTAGGVQQAVPGTFQIDAGGSANFWMTINGPTFVHPRLPPVFTVNWGNSGNVDAPVELVNLQVSSSNGVWSLTPGGAAIPGNYLFLAMAPGAPNPVIPPGASESLSVYFAPTGLGQFSIKASYSPISSPDLGNDAINWGPILAAARPAQLDSAQWSALSAQLASQLGTNWSSLAQELAPDAVNLLNAAASSGSQPSAGAGLLPELLVEIDNAESALGWTESSVSGSVSADAAQPAAAAAADAAPADAQPRPGQVRSLVVALDGYPAGVGNLPGADHDLRAVRSWLGTQVEANPANTTILTNVPVFGLSTPANISPTMMENAVKSLVASTQPGDTAFIYYSGHGLPPGQNGITGAFELDGPTGNDGYDYKTFLNDLIPCQADHIVIVVDACYSGSLIDALNNSTTVPDSVKSKITIVTSAQSFERAPSHGYSGGLFTEAFFDALKNPANDTDHDGVVSLREAYNAIPKKLGLLLASEHPDFPLDVPDVPVVDAAGGAKHPINQTLTSEAPPGDGAVEEDGDTGDSNDPNELVTTGYGSAGFVSPSQSISYDIFFENVPPAGVPSNLILPAQEVVVTDQLPPQLDWSSLQLDAVGFGSTVVPVPPGQSTFTGTGISATDPNDPVGIQVSFDAQTGTITWDLRSMDPTTGLLPENPRAGFLPVDNSTGQGEGFVSFQVNPAAGLADGTQINNSASIVFDINKPLATNSVLNTIDSIAPTSSVTALPAVENTANFTVSWSGSDDPSGSGLAYYNEYVSDNGGPYTPWLTDTTQTSATFQGQNQHTYTFHSIAVDNAGNIQPTPAAPQATTLVNAPLISSVTTLPAVSPDSFTLSWSGTDTGGPGIASYTIYESDNGGPFQAYLTDTTLTSTNFTGQPGHTYGFYSVATDNHGDVQPTPSAAQATTTVSSPPPPPPLVKVTGVRDMTNKKHQATQVIITFSGALNAAEADQTGIYRLAIAGKKGSYTAKNAQVIKLKSALYSAAGNTVTLTPKKAFALTKPVQLVVKGTPPSGLQDTLGRFLGGGTNAVAILSSHGTTIQTAAVAATRLALVASAVDALLERETGIDV
jgi:hypothetical protein